jgi:hypothetical protein
VVAMTCNHVESFLRKLCGTTFEGGRVVRGDSDTILLYDVPSWPGVRTDALRERFPHCDIDVHQAQNSSASGFVVVVSMRDPVSYSRVLFTVMVSVAAAVLTGLAAMHVSLAEYPDWGDVNLYDTLNESCTNETL